MLFMGVDLKFEKCYQVMDADSEARLREWAQHRSDLTDFDRVTVVGEDGTTLASAAIHIA